MKRVRSGGVGMLLVETSERFLVQTQIARRNVNIADEFVDVFRDDLELDGHLGETFAIGTASLNGELVY